MRKQNSHIPVTRGWMKLGRDLICVKSTSGNSRKPQIFNEIQQKKKQHHPISITIYCMATQTRPIYRYSMHRQNGCSLESCVLTILTTNVQLNEIRLCEYAQIQCLLNLFIFYIFFSFLNAWHVSNLNIWACLISRIQLSEISLKKVELGTMPIVAFWHATFVESAVTFETQ